MPILGRPMFSLQPPEPPDPALAREIETVIEYIIDTQDVRRVMMGPFVRLEADLGIAGEKGDRFLHAFAERFDVDMSAARGPYFTVEGFRIADAIGAALALPVVLYAVATVGVTRLIDLAPWGIGALCLAFLFSKGVDEIITMRSGPRPKNVQITVSDLARSMKEKRWTVKAEAEATG